MKLCTSIEQSKKLMELGININTADMHYSTWTILNEGEYILSPNQGETIEELQEDYGNAAFEMIVWLKENGEI